MKGTSHVGWIAPAGALVLLAASMPADEIVTFPDPNLETAVRDELGIPRPTPINAADMLRLTSLHAQHASIRSLEGLEYAVALDALGLPINDIEDLSPLSGLADLRVLDLKWNQIRDISPLADLRGLHFLELYVNQVTDIAPISGLTELYVLNLADNGIDDISPLLALSEAGAANLEDVVLMENHITDVSVFGATDFPRLRCLWLRDNQISDIGPLTQLTGLDILDISGNPLNDAAFTTHIPLIVANNPGILLHHDPILEPGALSVSCLASVLLLQRSLGRQMMRRGRRDID